MLIIVFANTPRMKKLFILLVSFILHNAVFATIPEAEKKALIDFYTSTNGLDWNKSWDLSKDAATWYGVEIKDNHVISLHLVDNNLNGTLPNSLGALDKLQVLNLAFNLLEGEVPSSVFKLKKLMVLRLGKNKLTGNIPNEIGDLKNLVILDFFSNQLSGILPRSIGTLKNLKVLLISDNNITGRIPEEIGALIHLERFEIADNNIYGDVPVNFGLLSNLKMLVLSENRLSGEFPSVIFSLPNLKALQIQKNLFDQEHLLNSIPTETDLALLDFDNDKNLSDRKNFKDIYRSGDTRMADTIFEEDKENK